MYSNEFKEACRKLFIKGYTLEEIAEEMNMTSPRILYVWRDKESWDEHVPYKSIEDALARRIVLLTDRENKTDDDAKELDRLVNTYCNLHIGEAKAAKIRAEAKAIESGDESGGGKSKRKRKKKNDLSHVTEDIIKQKFEELFFEYQLLWLKAKQDPEKWRNRWILKARQIGATFYFAFEALADAILTGDNQIFMSASRPQAEIFRAYIVGFAREHFDTELKGNPIILSNGAELHFLSTNSRTSQGYHGHLYGDECFWWPDFDKLFKVVTAMAAHKKWRRTFFSSPSSINHPATKVWNGDKYNKGKKEKHEFDLSDESLLAGIVGPDKIWRNKISIEDAEKMGCDLFDIDELRTEYNKDDFDNLFMCKFIDDAKSAFHLSDLLTSIDEECANDYRYEHERPYEMLPVAVGYDPSRTRDDASVAITAPPLQHKGDWILLEKKSFHSRSFQYQSEEIEKITDTHNVVHIGIDVTGMGIGVFELVKKFFPRAMPIHYSVEVKNRLVLKGKEIIEGGRFKYDGDKNVTQSFLAIHKTVTNGGAITYGANRSVETGHADVGWAILHAMAYEDLGEQGTEHASVSFG